MGWTRKTLKYAHSRVTFNFPFTYQQNKSEFLLTLLKKSHMCWVGEFFSRSGASARMICSWSAWPNASTFYKQENNTHSNEQLPHSIRKHCHIQQDHQSHCIINVQPRRFTCVGPSNRNHLTIELQLELLSLLLALSWKCRRKERVLKKESPSVIC